MIQLLPWPSLPEQFWSSHRIIEENQHLLEHPVYPYQEGWSRFGGIKSWPGQQEFHSLLQPYLGISVQPQQVHLQWCKTTLPLHRDKNRRWSAMCTLTPDHPTSFAGYTVTMRQYQWYLFNHSELHGVPDLKEFRYSIAIDLTEQFPTWSAACQQLAGLP